MGLQEIFDRARVALDRSRLPVVIIGDFAKDLDDEMALMLAVALQRVGEIELRAVVGNLEPALGRARVAKGTLEALGLESVRVGIGSPVYVDSVNAYELDVPYKAEASRLVGGHELLVETLEEAEPNSLHLVLQSGLTDAVRLLEERPALFRDRIRAVAIMGGVRAVVGEGRTSIVSQEGLMVPDDAHNNMFDFRAAEVLYSLLQQMAIPIDLLTRDAAYGCQIPFSLFDAMAETGHPVGACLQRRQQPAIRELWAAACSPAGSEVRGSLPENRDRAWFVDVFCDGRAPPVRDEADIWPFVRRCNLYDPLNLAAAVPSIRRRFFEPRIFRTNGVEHRIYGVSAAETGIADEDGLRDFLTEILRAVLEG